MISTSGVEVEARGLTYFLKSNQTRQWVILLGMLFDPKYNLQQNPIKDAEKQDHVKKYTRYHVNVDDSIDAWSSL